MGIFLQQVKKIIFMKKKNLQNNKDNIIITEDLTKFRQSIIKELNTQKKATKKKNTVCNFKYKNAQEYIIVECLLFF
jgi:hypothetical protein